ncbi:hypothetical protein [Nonomuraea jabiensis]|uniref:hypothetical protein n=1 Tax=Nonomuraea jabiensis TaxID=882448 RepID=UPI003D73231C
MPGRESDQGYDPSEFVAGPTGKVTLQTYVPASLYNKVKQVQQTGRSAELIVLTAVNAAADEMPELIRKARGPVHEGGLFPGLQVLERGPGRPKHIEPANTRLQYQVSARWLPALRGVAQKYNLRQSVLARLALGHYFGIPVSIDRVR